MNGSNTVACRSVWLLVSGLNLTTNRAIVVRMGIKA
jgi:hypothetical protein